MQLSRLTSLSSVVVCLSILVSTADAQSVKQRQVKTATNEAAKKSITFEAVQKYLERSVKDGTVAGGSLLVLHRGDIVFATGFGFANLKTKRAFKVDTPGVIASISKPILATAAFRLVEAGKLDVTAPITNYLPEFKNAKLGSGRKLVRAPTMTELFTHTSGMRKSTASGGRPWFSTWTRGQSLEFVVKKYAREFPFEEAPGKRHAYSGIGTDVAARVTEVVSGKPRNEMLIQQVCRPLGMTHTFYRDKKGIANTSMPTKYFRGKNGKLLVSSKRPLPPTNTYSSSGGSMISTTQDLAKWLLMIRNRGQHGGQQYLTDETISEMLTAHNVGTNARGALFVRKRNAAEKPIRYGHTGSTGTNCWIDFETDTIGIMLTQTRGSDIRPFRVELEKRVGTCVAKR